MSAVASARASRIALRLREMPVVRVDVDAVARGPLDGRVAEAPPIGASAVEHVSRGRDEHDLAVTEPVEVVDEHPRGFAEVEVEHVDILRVPRQPDEGSGLACGA
jgi:hypothetical protein